MGKPIPNCSDMSKSILNEAFVWVLIEHYHRNWAKFQVCSLHSDLTFHLSL